MSDTARILRLLGTLSVITYTPNEVTVATGRTVTADEIAAKAQTAPVLVTALLATLADLTSVGNKLMKARASELKMDDFFVASPTAFGEAGVVFTLYGEQGSVYETALFIEDLISLASQKVSSQKVS